MTHGSAITFFADRTESGASSIERYRSIVQNSLEGIFQSTVDGRYLLVNPALARMYGYDSPAELLESVDDISRSIYVDPRMREEFKRRIDQDGEVSGFEYEVRRRDGRVIWISEHSRAVRNEQGALLYYEGFIQDITRRKRAEEQLRAAKERAEQASTAKSRFLAMMSHEIRTPMNGVIGMAALLMQTEQTPEQRDYTRTIHQSGEALLTVINDILDFSKVEAGRMLLEDEPFDLHACLEGTLDLIGPLVTAKSIELLYEAAEDLPSVVRGDCTRLRQVIVNLLGNAVKFTERGEVALSSSAKPLRPGWVSLMLEIRDTGIGIPPEAIGRVFDSFSQVDTSTTRKYGGTGLGLAISRQLVGLMKGDIGVTSTPGAGTTFRITIPLAVETGSQPPRPPAMPATDARRLLIIDDNASSRRILLHGARRLGLSAAAADSGASAMAMIGNSPAFDFILLDEQLPDTDAFALARLIKSQPAGASPKLILLSTCLGNCTAGEKSLFHSVLAKPLKPLQLRQLLHPTPVAVTSVTSPRVSPSKHSSLRLLLAEDNPVNRLVANRMLERLGYKPDHASNGREAWEAAHSKTYDAILLDVQMPEMDGLEVARRLRNELGPRCPRLIAITANAMQGDRDACLAAGMDDYLTKPIRPADLSASLERVPGPSVAASSTGKT